MYNKNAWEKYTAKEFDAVMEFSEGYKNYLTASKTEREMVISSVELAKKYGYKDIKEFKTFPCGSRKGYKTDNK